ncbi:MAG: hypothetical protein B7X41_17150, partial [Microbacterium sp. 14-71-5]
MDDARERGTPRGAVPGGLTRRELRQRREAAAIAGVPAERVDPATGLPTAPVPDPTAEPRPGAPAAEDTARPPGGVSFGSLAGMF